ncbi:MAG: amino acid permease [Phenylobacterium sp.]
MTTTTADAATPAASHHSSLSVLGAAALVMGSMMGSGVYLLPAALGAIGSISILGWLVSSAVALAVAAMFAQLVVAAPDARGVAGYVQAGLGRFVGAQATVLYWTSYWFGNVAVAVAAAGYLGFLFPALATPGARLAATLAVIWTGVGVSWVGPRMVGRVESLTLAVGLAPILLTATLGWFWFDPHVFAQSWNPAGAHPLAAIRGSAFTAFWAFLGLECAVATSGVVRNPVRNVPRATLGGVAGAAGLYIIACAVLMGLMPAAVLAKSTAPFADAARVTVGVAGAGLIAACAFLRASGCLTGITLVASETTREAADQGAFLSFFRTRPGERASPINLLTAGGLMTAVAFGTAAPSLADQFSRIISATVVMSLTVYALAGLSLFRLRGAFATPRARAIAAGSAIVASLAAVAMIASGSKIDLMIGLSPLILATALYLWLRRR